MMSQYIDGANASLCAERVRRLIHRVDGKWKLLILSHLYEAKVLRFSELERAIPQASQKMLTQHLRDLERDGLVQRIVYPEIPPRVEYRLTDKGIALEPVFQAIANVSS
jgi:DNA-binding HxlR family transcriptional regulator